MSLLASFLTSGQSQKTYVLDTDESVINWIGNYVFNFGEHRGTVKFREGTLNTANGDIVGGSFEIDMTSISNPEYLEGIGPVKHLRDTDFFHVSKFPTSTLEITRIEYFESENIHRFYANLTIKGITKPVKFMATANPNDKTVEARFKIDRTRWGINYNNKLKDDAIAEGIGFEVYLKFKE